MQLGPGFHYFCVIRLEFRVPTLIFYTLAVILFGAVHKQR